jgi:hypothetical protein
MSLLVTIISALCFAWWVVWKYQRGSCLDGKFHDWPQWQSVSVEVTPLGLIYPKEVRGTTYVETQQSRRCNRCGLVETAND